jgi:hypothetical protein
MAIIEPGKPVPLWVYGAGSVVVFGGYFFYRSRRNKAAATAAAASPKQAAATATSTPVVPAASYGNADNAGALANITQQLASLNAAQATTQGAAAQSGVNSGTANATNQELVGSGYYPRKDAKGNRAQRIEANGHTYQWVPNGDVAAALGGFNNLFIQALPGVFVKNTGGVPVVGGTPLFAQVA